MANTTNKKFLDEVGLALLWEKIQTGFAPRWSAYKPSATTATQEASVVKMPFSSAGILTVDGTKYGEPIVVTIPAATTDAAGVMTKADKTKLDNMSSSITGAITLSNVAIENHKLIATNVEDAELTDANGNKVVHEKCINFGFDYNAQKLRLLDRNNSNKVLGSVDLTDIIKDRFLNGVEVVDRKDGETEATGLWLKMIFLTKDLASNTDATETVYVSLLDLVDVYTAGTGISITNGAENSADSTKRSSTIKLKAATASAIGGAAVHAVSTTKEAVALTDITKRYFGVELGKSNKAIVNVPIGTLTKADSVYDSTGVTLSPSAGGSVDLAYEINDISQNADNTGNIIKLGTKKITLAKETSVTIAGTGGDTGATLKFGDTFKVFKDISVGDTNGHQITRSNTTWTLPSLTKKTATADTTQPDLQELVADNSASQLSITCVSDLAVTETGDITPITKTYTAWVNVLSIEDSTIDALTYPLS